MAQQKQFDEQEILHQLADPSKRRKAFEAIVNQYSQLLYWKIRAIVFVHDDADDVLQNTFMKAWANLPEFRNLAKISTWLYRIAINEALDLLRKRNRANNIDIESASGVAESLMADPYFDGDRTQALVQEAIATLPEVQRLVFSLRYYDNMKYSEMSQALNTSEGALKASYHIAMKKVTEYVEKQQV